MSKSSTMLFLVVVVSCLVCVQSQSIFFGGCPSVNVVPNFDANKYLGDWYENRKYCATFEFAQRCIKATYTDNGDGNVGVTNSALQIITGIPLSVSGYARPLEPPSGKLGVTFTSFEYSPTDSPYWVLGTDYTSYAVVWSCSDFGLFNTQLLWILTREREPSAEAINSAFAIIDDNNLNRNKLRVTDQSNCSN